MSLADEIRGDTRQTNVCSVCEWLEQRDDAAEWDAIMAAPVKHYGHTAIWRAMVKRGYRGSTSHKAVESHRQRGHRATS